MKRRTWFDTFIDTLLIVVVPVITLMALLAY